MPHICPVLADVGFNGRPPITLYQQQILSIAIYALHSQGLRFVESHICQLAQIWGTRALSQTGLLRNPG